MSYGISLINNVGVETFLDTTDYINKVVDESVACTTVISGDQYDGYYENTTFPYKVTVPAYGNYFFMTSKFPGTGVRVSQLPYCQPLASGSPNQINVVTPRVESSHTFITQIYQQGPINSADRDSSTHGVIIYDSSADTIFDSRNKPLSLVNYVSETSFPSSWDFSGTSHTHSGMLTQIDSLVDDYKDITVLDTANHYFNVRYQSLYKIRTFNFWVLLTMRIINSTTIRLQFHKDYGAVPGFINHRVSHINLYGILPLEIFEFA